MQIENRAILVLYRLAVTLLSILGIWAEYSRLGPDMLRDFSSWFLIATAGYFLISTIVTIFRRKHSPSYTFWPVFEGMLLVSGMILFVGQIVFFTLDYAGLGLSPLIIGLVYFVLPIMILIDWLFFSEKGRWRFSDPLYWLALPTIFTCWILASASMMPDSAHLRYPYDFLNWPEITIPSMFWQLVIIVVLIIAFSYICWLIDFAMSGNLSKNIVLPRIKTIVIEENDEDDNSAVQKPEPQPSSKAPAKVKVEGLQDAKSAQNIHQSKPAKRIRVDENSTDEQLKAAKEISRPQRNIKPENSAKSNFHNAQSVHSGPKPSTRKSDVSKDTSNQPKPQSPKSQSEKPTPKAADSEKAEKAKKDKKPAQKSKTEQKPNTQTDAKSDHKPSSVSNEPKIRIVEQIGEFKDDKPKKSEEEKPNATKTTSKPEKSKAKRSSDPV